MNAFETALRLRVLKLKNEIKNEQQKNNYNYKDIKNFIGKRKKILSLQRDIAEQKKIFESSNLRQKTTENIIEEYFFTSIIGKYGKIRDKDLQKNSHDFFNNTNKTTSKLKKELYTDEFIMSIILPFKKYLSDEEMKSFIKETRSKLIQNKNKNKSKKIKLKIISL